jgi:hypothetical protein
VDLNPADPLAPGYLSIVEERLRVGRAGPRVQAPLPLQTVLPTPAPVVAETRLEVYFNCPLSAATLEVDLDGEALARKQLNYYTKGFLGIKKKGAGVYQEVFTIRSGNRSLGVRLRDEAGVVLAEQTLPAALVPGGRAILKVEMENERAVPRFSLTAARPR